MGQVSKAQGTSISLEERLRRIEDYARLGAKNVWSVKELALYLGRAEKTIRNNIDNIPHYRGETGITFRREEIEAWQCQVKCTPLTIR